MILKAGVLKVASTKRVDPKNALVLAGKGIVQIQ